MVVVGSAPGTGAVAVGDVSVSVVGAVAAVAVAPATVSLTLNLPSCRSGSTTEQQHSSASANCLQMHRCTVIFVTSALSHQPSSGGTLWVCRQRCRRCLEVPVHHQQ